MSGDLQCTLDRIEVLGRDLGIDVRCLPGGQTLGIDAVRRSTVIVQVRAGSVRAFEQAAPPRSVVAAPWGRRRWSTLLRRGATPYSVPEADVAILRRYLEQASRAVVRDDTTGSRVNRWLFVLLVPVAAVIAVLMARQGWAGLLGLPLGVAIIGEVGASTIERWQRAARRIRERAAGAR